MANYFPSNKLNNKHRMLGHYLLTSALVLSLQTESINARVTEKIYSNLQSNHYCGRRLNATHHMGCTSDLGGNTGVIWIIDHQSDLDHVLKSGPTPPYVAVLKRNFYTRGNLLEFKANPDRVTGVVLIDDDHSDPSLYSSPFSPEDTCPARYSGLYANDSLYQNCKQNVWIQSNPVSGLLQDDIPFPIFLINERESKDKIEKCFIENNLSEDRQQRQKSFPLCSMQLDSFMLAARDTKTCLNSHSFLDELLQTSGRRCYSVDNRNIFAYYKSSFGPLRPSSNSAMIPALVKPQSVVMLMARLSSLSMFTDVSPGADSTLSSIIVMLTVAEALSKLRNKSVVSKSERNIAFALLDSEPFDYTGSSRMALSMRTNSFPHKYFETQNVTDAISNINLMSIDYILNLDQLANYPNMSRVYLHSDPSDANSQRYRDVIKVFQKIASDKSIELGIEDENIPLPPTPVQEFIRQVRLNKTAETKLLGLVLSNYGKQYNNLFYNSIYDDSKNLFRSSRAELINHLTKISELVAESTFKLAFDHSPQDIKIDSSIISELLDCYLANAECPLFTTAWQAGQQLPKGPILTYKDPTKRSDDMNGAITSSVLSYFLSEKLPGYNFSSCFRENEISMIYDYMFINGKSEPVKDLDSGLCIRSQVLKTAATSPAYEITEDGIIVNPEYPAWTVSLQNIRNPVRIFMKSSPIHQWCLFMIGIVISAMSLMIVNHVKGSIVRLKVGASETFAVST